MAPRVEISPAAANEPVAVPREVALRSLDALPRTRPVTLALLAHELQPGLAPAPWALRGVAEALEQLGLRVRELLLLGDVATAEHIVARGAPELGLGRDPNAGREDPATLRLAVNESRRSAVVPRAWIGSNLVVLAPLTHRRHPGGWRGPCEQALHELALRLGYGAPTDPTVRVGARLVSEIFASATTMIDAHWWAAADQDGALCSEAVAPEHVLGAAIGEPFGHGAVDDWLAGLLNLRATLRAHRPERGADGVISVGGKRRPWPAVQLAAEGPGLGGEGRVGLASRAVQALWRSTGEGRAHRGERRIGAAATRRRLGPPVPGAFAEHWRSYRAVDLETATR